jgi:hypothetical protein
LASPQRLQTSSVPGLVRRSCRVKDPERTRASSADLAWLRSAALPREEPRTYKSGPRYPLQLPPPQTSTSPPARGSALHATSLIAHIA